MKQEHFYGRIKKETEKAILIDGEWIPKSAIIEKVKVIKENGFPLKKEEFYVHTSFPLNVSGWSGGITELELEDGRIIRKNM